MKVLVAGDTHANPTWIRQVVATAVQEQADVIFQIGDFGWWPHVPWGAKFIDFASHCAKSAGLDLCFIDGNHDNIPNLWAPRKLEASDRQTWGNAIPGATELRERLFYVPRGTRWMWDGVSFLALGGAYSIDKLERIERMAIERMYGSGAVVEEWWAEELIRQEDVEKAIGVCSPGDPVDVMFTHDAPLGVPMFDINGTRFKNDGDSLQNRAYVRAVLEAARPNWLFHGHYHVRHRFDLDLDAEAHFEGQRKSVCRVEGLGRDSDPNSLYMIDTVRL